MGYDKFKIFQAVRESRKFPSPADACFTTGVVFYGAMLPYHDHEPHIEYDAPSAPQSGRVSVVITSTSTAGPAYSIAPIWPDFRRSS
jgi:hypothetical protein